MTRVSKIEQNGERNDVTNKTQFHTIFRFFTIRSGTLFLRKTFLGILEFTAWESRLAKVSCVSRYDFFKNPISANVTAEVLLFSNQHRRYKRVFLLLYI